MTTITDGRSALGRPRSARLGVRLAVAGAGLGVVAGLAELLVGPEIRTWVGDEQDTTRLGLATILLAAVALACATTLARRPTANAPWRFALALGLVLAGLVCFTTVGRLWYIPGPLLVAAGAVVVAGTWSMRHAIAVAAERSWGRCSSRFSPSSTSSWERPRSGSRASSGSPAGSSSSASSQRATTSHGGPRSRCF